MGLFNGLSYNGINLGLQSNHLSGLANGLISNEIPENTKAFITIWDTRNTSTGSSTNKQIKLPLLSTGTYNFVVDWGDGSKDIIRAYNAAAVTHTYASAGIYTIKIKGTITSMQFTFNSTDTLKILEIVQWGSFKPLDIQTFANCINLRLNNTRDLIDLSDSPLNAMYGLFNSCTMPFISGIGQWDITKVNSLFTTFQQNSGFNDGSINQWNTSNITNMMQTFYLASVFNQDIGNWDTSNVTTMQNMFLSTAFNNGNSPTISGWTTSNVINMNNMFGGCANFNQPIGSWNVSSVTDMANMFNNTTVFNQPLSGWNVSGVTSMANMFNGAAAFNQNINNWNVGKVVTMTGMFNFATVFNQPLSGWTTSACTNMSYMFYNATAFNQNINNWNVSGVTNMASMFQSATAFNQPLSGWNTSKVTLMNNMFQSATAFTQNINNWNVSGVTNMASMFQTATAFNQPLSGWNVSNVIDMNNMFTGAAGVSAFNQNIGSWIPSACTNFTSFMFGKTPATYSQTNLDAIYSGWTQNQLQPTVTGPIDFGTVKYSSGNIQSVGGRTLLTNPTQLLVISNCVNNGSGLIRVTSATQTLVTGNKVFISSVLGTVEANGPWIVTVINSTTIDLQGSTFVNTYSSGGLLRTGYGWTIVDGGGV